MDEEEIGIELNNQLLSKDQLISRHKKQRERIQRRLEDLEEVEREMARFNRRKDHEYVDVERKIRHQDDRYHAKTV